MNSDGIVENEQCILVECPRWGDAKFLGNWLLAADKANNLLMEVREDLIFADQISTLEMVYVLDFAGDAYFMATECGGNVAALIINYREEAEGFAMMVEMGFFKFIDGRYQMVVPNSVAAEDIRRALQMLARTEDAEHMLHPDHLVRTMSRTEANKWQTRLKWMRDMRDISRSSAEPLH